MATRSRGRVDTLYAKKLKKVSDFTFDRAVADAFDDMIVRSVPFYNELQTATVDLAARFVRKHSRVYDLGCATGTTLRLLSRAIRDPTVAFLGLDGSVDMVRRARRKAAGLKDHRLTFAVEDLASPFALVAPSVVIMGLTLQFLKPRDRLPLIALVHQALKPTGCLIVIEKVVGIDASTTRLMNAIYYDFKRRNRYSELEIAQKREALEHVLVPYTLEDNIRLLREAGFSTVDVFFKWFNFAGLIAVK